MRGCRNIFVKLGNKSQERVTNIWYQQFCQDVHTIKAHSGVSRWHTVTDFLWFLLQKSQERTSVKKLETKRCININVHNFKVCWVGIDEEINVYYFIPPS